MASGQGAPAARAGGALAQREPGPTKERGRQASPPNPRDNGRLNRNPSYIM